MTESRIYHIAFVVPELEPAMAELSAVTGVTWAGRQDVPVTYQTPYGPRTWDTAFVYSREAPYIELLKQIDGSVWHEPGFHHLGLWTGDVHAESENLERQGCTWQAAMADDDGIRQGGCYHLLPTTHARVELVSEERSRPRLERYLSGGHYM